MVALRGAEMFEWQVIRLGLDETVRKALSKAEEKIDRHVKSDGPERQALYASLICLAGGVVASHFKPGFCTIMLDEKEPGLDNAAIEVFLGVEDIIRACSGDDKETEALLYARLIGQLSSKPDVHLSHRKNRQDLEAAG